MRMLIAVVVVGLLPFNGAAGSRRDKPTIRVAADGFPTGRGAPEGAAADLARAFIRRDPALFRRTCVRLYGPAEYSHFLDGIERSMKEEAARVTPSPGGPKSIEKVFAARHLSRGGPASYGQAAFGFRNVMFVDVGVLLHNGERALNRTMVIEDRDGEWYVHPDPGVSPLLSAGLNEEGPSRRDFSEAYVVVK